MNNDEIFVHYCPACPIGIYLSHNAICISCYLPKNKLPKVLALSVPYDKANDK